MATPKSVRVITFHSFKGGVGKTTLALSAAVLLAREPGAKPGAVCLIDLDFFGAPLHPETLAAATSNDILDAVLRYDRATPSGFPKTIRAHSLEVVDSLGSEGSGETRKIAYLGTGKERARSFAPLAMGGWQCAYVAERLRTFIRHVGANGLSPIEDNGEEAFPKCFIIDNAPGLCGISSRIFEWGKKDEISGTQSGTVTASVKLDHTRVLVVTPQMSDTRALERFWETARTGAAARSNPSPPTVVLNRARKEHLKALYLARGDENQSKAKETSSRIEHDHVPKKKPPPSDEILPPPIPTTTVRETLDLNIKGETLPTFKVEEDFRKGGTLLEEDSKITVSSQLTPGREPGSLQYRPLEARLTIEVEDVLRSILRPQSEASA